MELHVIDYLVIVGAVVLSSAAGLYYGMVKKKSESLDEYFLASRKIGTLQMAFSMAATIVSSSGLVGIVVEIYYYGIQAIWGCLNFYIAMYLNLRYIFPVFFQIGGFDLNKYYELRFHKMVRYSLSFLTIVEKTLSTSIAIYALAIVLSKVININTWIIVILVTTICAFYSAMGGVRGVTLADTLQAIVIFTSIFVLIIVGTVYVGGFKVVFLRNWDSGRIELFNFDVNPQTRHTFWTNFGYFVQALSGSVTSPTTTLRVMGSSSYRQFTNAILYGTLIVTLLNILTTYLGILAYSWYYQCDPIKSKIISSSNQLLPLFINDVLSSFPGLPGLVYSGIICAAISTISSNFNGLSALAVETFIRPFNIISSDRAYTWSAKIIVFILGVIAIIGIAVVQSFPNLFQAMIILSFSNGPQFVLLLAGMLFPQAKFKASVGSFILGIIFMLWLLVGNVLIKPIGTVKLFNQENCSQVLNYTNYEMMLTNSSSEIIIDTPTTDWTTYFPLSSASMAWHTSMGLLFSLFAFFILSILLGPEKHEPTDLSLIPERIQGFHKSLSRKWRRVLLCDVYFPENIESKEIQPLNDTTNEKISEKGFLQDNDDEQQHMQMSKL